MITYYTYDAQGVFVGAVERTKYEALPKPCTTVAPPSLTGTEVARWDGSAWDVLAERPPLPLPDVAEVLAAERAAMVCTPAQMRLALLGAGLLATVQAIADSDPAAAIIWEYATQIVRTSPFIDALGGPNGFTPEQIDDLFRAAMAVDV